MILVSFYTKLLKVFGKLENDDTDWLPLASLDNLKNDKHEVYVKINQHSACPNKVKDNSKPSETINQLQTT